MFWNLKKYKITKKEASSMLKAMYYQNPKIFEQEYNNIKSCYMDGDKWVQDLDVDICFFIDKLSAHLIKVCDMDYYAALNHFKLGTFLYGGSYMEQKFFLVLEFVRLYWNCVYKKEAAEREFIICREVPYSFGKGENYRVDFFIAGWNSKHVNDTGKFHRLVVELDSKSWHDRSEEERSREKRRDRTFMKNGYLTFRYTWSDIENHPINTAIEVMKCCGMFKL